MKCLTYTHIIMLNIRALSFVFHFIILCIHIIYIYIFAFLSTLFEKLNLFKYILFSIDFYYVDYCWNQLINFRLSKVCQKNRRERFKSIIVCLKTFVYIEFNAQRTFSNTHTSPCRLQLKYKLILVDK